MKTESYIDVIYTLKNIRGRIDHLEQLVKGSRDWSITYQLGRMFYQRMILPLLHDLGIFDFGYEEDVNLSYKERIEALLSALRSFEDKLPRGM